MRYFENIKTVEELKKLYKKLTVKNHPDNGGCENIMAQINKEYDELLKHFEIYGNFNTKEENKKNNIDIELKKIIEKLQQIQDLNKLLDAYKTGQIKQAN